MAMAATEPERQPLGALLAADMRNDMAGAADALDHRRQSKALPGRAFRVATSCQGSDWIRPGLRAADRLGPPLILSANRCRHGAQRR